MPPLLRTPAMHQQHQPYQELTESLASQQMKHRSLQTSSLSLIKNEKQQELHLTLLMLSSKVGDENKFVQELGLVYTAAKQSF